MAEVFFCSHQSCLPNPPQSHRLPSCQSAPLSSTCLPDGVLLLHFVLSPPLAGSPTSFSLLLFTHRPSYSSPEQTPPTQLYPSTGFLWVLDFGSRQGMMGIILWHA